MTYRLSSAAEIGALSRGGAALIPVGRFATAGHLARVGSTAQIVY